MVVEGERGVTLEVEVKEGEIPVGSTVEVFLATTDLSANGKAHVGFQVEFSTRYSLNK